MQNNNTTTTDGTATARTTGDDGRQEPADEERTECATSVADRHSARGALYGALGASLCYPTEERLADLEDEAVQESLREAGDRLDLGTETAAFCEAVATTDLETARRRHDELFGLPDAEGTYPVVPYEANYTTSGEGGEAQRRIATVVGLMEAFDVQPAETFHERQDHVAAELELAAIVAAKRAVAVAADASGDAVQHLRGAERTLLDEHLSDFVPALAHDVRAATDDPLLEATVALAAALVRRDAAESQGVSDDA